MLLLSLERRGLTSAQQNLHSLVRAVNAGLDGGAVIYQSAGNVSLKTERYPEGHVFPGGTIVFETGAEAAGCFCDTLRNDIFTSQKSMFRRLSKPSGIAFYTGLNSADFCAKPYKNLLDSMGFAYEELGDGDIRAGWLDGFGLLIVPGGPDAGESYYQGLGSAGYDRVKSFIYDGGSFLGSCAGAYLPLSAPEGSDESRIWLGIVDAGDAAGLNYWRTGAGMLRVSLCGAGPAAFGLEYGAGTSMDVIYWEGPVFEQPGEGVKVLARYEEFIASGSQPPSWDIAANPSAVEMTRCCNPLTKERFDRYMKGMPAALSSRYGKGRLILYSFHPEFGYPNCDYENDLIHLFISNAIYELCS